MKLDETLSAALDGECSPEELDQLLSGLENDPSAMQRWQRWSSVKASIAGVRTDHVSSDWSNAVMKSISMEPRPVVVTPTITRPLMASRVAQAPRRRRRRTWAAAGVTASLSVAVMGWMLVSNPAAVPDADVPAITPSVQAVSQIAQLSEPRGVSVASSSQDESWLINEYLMAHHQHAGAQTVGNTLRRARFEGLTHASFEESQR